MAAAAGETVTLQCPVVHCGKAVRVTWCKESDRCIDVVQTDRLEMTQTSRGRNRLLSSLTFKGISPNDGGIYKCSVNDNQNEEISHGINVSVSGVLGSNGEIQRGGLDLGADSFCSLTNFAGSNREVRYKDDNHEVSQNFPNSGKTIFFFFEI